VKVVSTNNKQVIKILINSIDYKGKYNATNYFRKEDFIDNPFINNFNQPSNHQSIFKLTNQIISMNLKVHKINKPNKLIQGISKRVHLMESKWFLTFHFLIEHIIGSNLILI